MQNRSVWFLCFGEHGHSAGCRRNVAGGCSGATIQSRWKRLMQRISRNALKLSGRISNTAGNMPALPFLGRRARYPIALAALFALVHTVCHAQEATPLLRRLKRRRSQWSSQRRVSIFRWINRPPL